MKGERQPAHQPGQARVDDATGPTEARARGAVEVYMGSPKGVPWADMAAAGRGHGMLCYGVVV